MAAALLCAAHAYYPDNFALRFDPLKHDVVRIPHDASFNAPLIDSWTVEIWVQPSPTQKHPGNGRLLNLCLLYTSPSPRDLSTSRMPSSA